MAEGAKKKIDNHVLISKDREGRGRFTFGRIISVIGLILMAAGIFVSYLFVSSTHGSEISNPSFVVSITDNSERIDEFICAVNSDSSTKALGLKFSCGDKTAERPVLTVRMPRQCLRCDSCERQVVPILENLSDIVSFKWDRITGCRRMNILNKTDEIVYVIDVNGRFTKVRKVS